MAVTTFVSVACDVKRTEPPAPPHFYQSSPSCAAMIFLRSFLSLMFLRLPELAVSQANVRLRAWVFLATFASCPVNGFVCGSAPLSNRKDDKIRAVQS